MPISTSFLLGDLHPSRTDTFLERFDYTFGDLFHLRQRHQSRHQVHTVLVRLTPAHDVVSYLDRFDSVVKRGVDLCDQLLFCFDEPSVRGCRITTEISDARGVVFHHTIPLALAHRYVIPARRAT